MIRLGDVTLVSGAFTCSAGFHTWKFMVGVLTKLSEPTAVKFVWETLSCFSLTLLGVAVPVLKGFSNLNALLRAIVFDESVVTTVCESDRAFMESVCAKVGIAVTKTAATVTVNLEMMLCFDMVTFSFSISLAVRWTESTNLVSA